jgi:hypothetical protein
MIIIKIIIRLRIVEIRKEEILEIRKIMRISNKLE